MFSILVLRFPNVVPSRGLEVGILFLLSVLRHSEFVPGLAFETPVSGSQSCIVLYK